MERTSWRRRARAFVPALLLLFALAGWMLPAAPGPAAEAVSALVMLGYAQSEASVAVGKLDSSLPVEELIKRALKVLARPL